MFRVSQKIMPTRETEGEACSRSSASKNINTVSDIFDNFTACGSFLLSSSKSVHVFDPHGVYRATEHHPLSVREVSLAHLRKVTARMPSTNSRNNEKTIQLTTCHTLDDGMNFDFLKFFTAICKLCSFPVNDCGSFSGASLTDNHNTVTNQHLLRKAELSSAGTQACLRA